MSRPYTQPTRLERVQALVERGATPGERAAARAALERLRARQPSSPQPATPQPIFVPTHLARWRGLLRTVANAPAKDRAGILHWATGRVRDARKGGVIDFTDVTVLLEALRRTAMQAGLGAWECERSISRSMKGQSR